MRYWKARKLTGNPKVGIAVAAYATDDRHQAALKALVASFEAQTYGNWQLEVTHDGPYPHDHGTLKFFDQWDGEPRVSVVETPSWQGKFGHPHRQAAIERLLAAGCEWIGLTNQDNYYAPVYLEWMLHTGQSTGSDLVYCDFVHSHATWKPRVAQLRRGYIDLGCFLAHRRLVEQIRFDKFEFAGDWDYISRLNHAAKDRSAKVPAVLFTHN